MPRDNYASEGGRVALDVFKYKHEPNELGMVKGATRKGDGGTAFTPESKDSESFTGKEEGFFAKFGSNEVDN